MNYKILILMALISSVLLSGCVERDVHTEDTIETPITSINEYPVVSVQHDQGDLWVWYNDNGSVKQAFVRPPTNPPRFNMNDEIIISNESKIVVYYHKAFFTNSYINYTLYWREN